MADDTVWLSVAPSFRGFGAKMVKEASGAAKSASKSIESELAGTGERAGRAAGKGITDGVRQSAAAVEKSTQRVVQARKREADAAANVTLAEARLADSRSKGKSTDTIARQEAALESARRRQATASSQLKGAEADLADVRAGGTGRSSTLIRSESAVESARLKAADATDRVQLAESKVETLRSSSKATNTQIAQAEATLTKARADQQSATEILSSKEELHALTLKDVGDKAGEVGTKSLGARDRVKQFGSGLSNAAEKARGFALGVGGAVAILGKMAFTAASDAQQAVGAVESVFGTNAAEVQGYANQAAQAVGLASSQYNELASVIGAQLKNLGMPVEQVAGQTNRLVEIGADMAATFGGTTQQAVEALGSALRGERDPIERYGVSITQASLNAWKAQNGLDGLTGAADKNADMMGTLALITDQTKDIQGQFGREADTAAGQQQRATAEFQNAKIAIGQGLLPVVTTLAEKFAGVARWAGEHPALIMGVAIAMGSLAAAVMTVNAVTAASTAIMATWNVVRGVMAAITGAGTAALTGSAIAMGAYNVVTGIGTAVTTAFGVAVAIATSPITLIIAAIAALVAGLVLFFTKTEIGRKIWSGFVNVLKGVWSWLSGVFATGLQWIGDVAVGAWNVAKAGFQAFVGFLQTAWNSVLKPVFDAISMAVRIVAAVLLTVLITPAIIAWNLLSAAIQLAWTTVIKPAWDALSAAALWLWNTVLKPVFTWIKLGFQTMANALWTIWSTVIKVAWDTMSAAALWLWNNVLKPTFNFIKLGFQALGTAFQWVWNTIIKPAWDALGAGIQWVWNTIVRPAWDAMKAALGVLGDVFSAAWNNVIKPVWDALGNGIRWVIDNIVKPAWDGMKTALRSVGDFFSTTVDGIGRAWDKVKEFVAKPINFVIDTVWNNGLVKAWNKIASFIPGLPEASTLEPVKFARGGAVLGAGTGTSDSIPARLSNGEHVWDTMDVVRAGGQRAMYAMRALIERGIPFTWDAAKGLGALGGRTVGQLRSGDERVGGQPADVLGMLHGLVPGFADGGAVDAPAWHAQIQRAHEWAKARHGRPYVLGGSAEGAGGTDCSGFMSGIADVIQGGNGARKWATMAFNGGGNTQHDSGPQGFVAGLSEGFSIGIHNGGAAGGHTAGTLSGVGGFSTVNVESGGSPSMVKYDVGAAGADDGYFETHYHLPIGADGAFQSAGGPSPEQQRGVIANKIKEILDKAMDWIKDGMGAAIGTPPPHWLGIPPNVLDMTKNAAVDTAMDFLGKVGDKLRAVYDKAKSVVTSITGLFRDNGGWIPTGQSVVTNETGKPEAVLNWDQLQQVVGLLQSLRGLEALQAWAGGNPAPAMSMGVERETVDAIEAMGVQISKDVQDLRRTAEQSFAKSVKDDVAGFFGFDGVVGDVEEIWQAFQPKEQAGGVASGGASNTTKEATQTAIASGGPVSGGQQLQYGDPNLRAETFEVPLETSMPDLEASGPTVGGDGSVKDKVRAEFAKFGWGEGAQWEAVDWIVGKESTWNPTARNPSSGAFGLFQFLGSTKDQYLPDENPDPSVQGNAGARYIRDRYGDPLAARAFWEQNGWYDQGGWLPTGVTMAVNGTGSPEAILTAAQWDRFDNLLKSLPSADEFQRITAAVSGDGEIEAGPGRGGGGGPLVWIDKLEARDEDDAMRAATREARRLARSDSLVGGWR